VFYFLLDYNGGENIRFAILVPVQNISGLVMILADHYKFFFSQKKLNQENWVPSGELFMPFPQNTVQYGLFKPASQHQQLSVLLQLADMLLEELIADEVDYESLIGLAFSLNIRLINLLLKRRMTEGEKLMERVSLEYNCNGDAYNKILSTNIETFIQLIQSNILKDEDLNEPANNTFESLVLDQINKINAEQSSEKVLTAFMEIKSIINHILGISPEMNKLISYSIFELQLYLIKQTG